MNTHISFPENLIDFLTWVKTTTEQAWRNEPPDSHFHGAQWLPPSEGEINSLENKYSIKFGGEHKAFLQTLHTINRKDPSYEGWENEEDDNEVKRMGHPSFFYNWLTDTNWIESRLTLPYKTILQDILGVNRVWLKSWGPRPDLNEEKTRFFSEWYSQAPRLLPITAHTFLMDHNQEGLKPALSVYGSDTIIAAWSLRHYLMRTFAKELNLETMIWDDEDKCYYSSITEGIPELDALQTIRLKDANIPYWKEIINYWSSRWEGFKVN